MFGFVVVIDAKATAAIGSTEGGLVYPDNSVVTILFYSQAAAVTSNLLLFHETTSPGLRQWPVIVFFNLHLH